MESPFRLPQAAELLQRQSRPYPSPLERFGEPVALQPLVIAVWWPYPVKITQLGAMIRVELGGARTTRSFRNCWYRV